jgi:putative membrane protein
MPFFYEQNLANSPFRIRAGRAPAIDGGSMKRTVYVIVGVIVILFGITFAFHNRQTVDVNYYFGLAWTGPLALALLAAVTFGVLVGFVASLRSVLRLQRQLAAARQDIRQMEQEVQALRALPIKDVI